jgi:hypothetical protein
MKTTSELVRRVASVLALGVAIAASAATSCVSTDTTISGPSVSGSLEVDAEHPIAIQRLTVSLNEVAAAAPGEAVIEVSRGGIDEIRMAVSPIDADLEAGLKTAYPYAFDPMAGDSAREVAPGSQQSFTISCTTPCERSFRIAAQFTGLSGSPTLRWTAVGSLRYTNAIWPSGAAMDIRVDPAVSVGGAGRSLIADLPSQTITLGAEHPAAASVVEVRLSAAAVPANPADVISTAVLVATRSSGSWRAEDVADGRQGVELRRLTPTVDTAWSLSLPQFEPFAGCLPGTDCVRTYLLTMQWWGTDDETETIDWSVHLSQLRLKGEPVADDALQVRVLRSFETTGAPQRAHYEGDLRVVPGKGGQPEASTAFAVEIQRADSGSGPPVPIELMPNPGVIHFRTSLPSGTEATLAPTDTLGTRVSEDSIGTLAIGGANASSVRSLLQWTPRRSEPLIFRVVATMNQDGATLTAPLTIHWTIDLYLYQYEDFPQYKLVPVPVPTPNDG